MTYLLAISIGPVQDFIAAARRCRDLWRGSDLLSELSKVSAGALLNNGATLVFPAANGKGELSEMTVANKILAKIESEDIWALVKRVEEETRAALQKEISAEKLSRENGLEVNRSLFDRQLEEFPEFHAAWVPSGDDYAAARKEVEGLLAARKVSRTFGHYRGQAGLAKSSLDGGREDVIEKRLDAPGRSLKGNEHLDAMGVIKRFTDRNPPFDSTTDVAAVPFVRGLKKQRPQVWKEYEGFLTVDERHRRVYSLLYEQEARQLFDSGYLGESRKNKLDKIRKAAGTPNPAYYALLHGDGDGVGEVIASLTKVEDHQAFSNRLGDFSKKVKDAVKGREGCPIYCGGDDVLVLLPLDEAFDCAQEINQLFRAGMRDYKATFSVGMAVAHALEPLTEVRRWALEAEREAKKNKGKDSLCISVRPRSGAPISVCGRWDELSGVLPDAVRHLKDDELPKGLAFDLEQLSAQLKRCPELEQVAKEMAESVIKKKQFSANAEEVRKFAIGHTSSREQLDRFGRTLLVANWFARAQREAEGRANEPHATD